MGGRFTVAIPGVELSESGVDIVGIESHADTKQTGIVDLHYRQKLNCDGIIGLAVIPPDFASQREM